MESLLGVKHWGFVVLLIPAVVGVIRACVDDVFIDESETPPSDEFRQNRGMQATKITRPLMIAVFLSVADFAVWKMFHD